MSDTIDTDLQTTQVDDAAPADGQNTDQQAQSDQQQTPKQDDKKPEHGDWRERRLANITRQRAEAEERATTAQRRAEQAEAELARFRATQPPEDRQPDPNEAQRQAERVVEQRMRAEAETRAFNEACNTTADRMRAEFGQDGFSRAVTGWTNAGLDLDGNKGHREILSLITSIDDGHKIYHRIGSDPNFAAHLLDLSPTKAALEIGRLLTPAQAAEVRAEAAAIEASPQGGALAASAAPSPQVAPAVSSAPRPPSQPAASRSAAAPSSNLYNDKMSAADWIAARNKQVRGT